MSARLPASLACIAIVLVLAALGTPAAAQTAAAAARTWPPSHLSDGQPDVQGYWRPVIGGGASLENPGVPQPIEDIAAGKPKKINPSRVVDPPDGKVPYQPWALALRTYQTENEDHPTKQDDVDTEARCFPLGVLRQAVNANQVLQSPGYFILLNEAYHIFRIIPLDGRPHLGSNIKLWQADSRGHWEGTTLVVDSTNFNGKNRITHAGDFVSDHAHVVERFDFTDADHLNYEVTIDDPTVFTRSWKMRIATVRDRQPADYEMWESACHEGEKSVDLMVPTVKAKP